MVGDTKLSHDWKQCQRESLTFSVVNLPLLAIPLDLVILTLICGIIWNSPMPQIHVNVSIHSEPPKPKESKLTNLPSENGRIDCIKSFTQIALAFEAVKAQPDSEK